MANAHLHLTRTTSKRTTTTEIEREFAKIMVESIIGQSMVVSLAPVEDIIVTNEGADVHGAIFQPSELPDHQSDVQVSNRVWQAFLTFRRTLENVKHEVEHVSV